MVVARNLFTHRQLNMQFEHRKILKIYHALVSGIPDWESMDVDIPLKVNGDRRHRTVPSPLEGKKAKTTFTIVNRYPHGCLVEARPHTGYTHQIRAHLASLGFPILGDTLYQNRQLTQNESGHPALQNTRTFLHAQSITFIHPQNLKKSTFFAPYPEDFLDAIRAVH